MLLSRATRTRLRMTLSSCLRTRAKNSYSTKGSSSGLDSFSSLMRYMTIAGVFSTPALWWLVTTRDDTIRDNAPEIETPPAEHWTVEPGPSRDQVTRILSQGEYSFRVRNIAGVNRYDGAQLASNSPCEDQFTHGKLPSPWKGVNKWMAWGVFDGHSGVQTSELLKSHLLPFVQYSLSQIKPTSPEDLVPDHLVQHAIMKDFMKLDDSIIKTAQAISESEESLQEKIKKLAPAYSSSCALLSMYDSATSTLHVACTGDSRAVLGQQRPDGRREAIPLSVDQTGKNKEEIARLHKEHPDEELEDMIKKGRVLGMAVSRAFGDRQWKWPIEFQKDIQRRFYGPPPLVPTYNVRTPPYLTAEPVVTSTKIDHSKPCFLIMAPDGLWDVISSQQAVNLVGKWLKLKESHKMDNDSELEPTYEPFDFGHFWKE
ncbi:protein serine/threonine phosphatase 2C [Penicillium malachiteum]|uniref:protein serine/threonine phosphatase 2C n=1 Tax=Penicillium malachiteum TaxID=1324776 RepID=UPI0025492629|nr:protein serine/threonine phosphatase 2C [Penicillium malachiteum]KAJ5737546.1 protein serine/threonine phosphatase 2C [Penicillium malachiteum]